MGASRGWKRLIWVEEGEPHMRARADDDILQMDDDGGNQGLWWQYEVSHEAGNQHNTIHV
ncbi:hypothetical protein VMCG_02845 [Cytospora schulzeri]|uniref:Uncharacterized protein n=1 Tax=Cytospora schulzeri TaxID=448051 RepID=A0A423WZF2_9PEZI|nr:hypothetical protein VMCG_02845 [Valsa malicola]